MANTERGGVQTNGLGCSPQSGHGPLSLGTTPLPGRQDMWEGGVTPEAGGAQRPPAGGWKYREVRTRRGARRAGAHSNGVPF